jgi:DnaK suppressor protein
MLNEQERARIEARLRQERERALEAIGEFNETVQDVRDATGELGLYRQHPADLGTEMMEKEKDFLLASVEGRRLGEVDDALRRLYSEPDRFGRCESCGMDVPIERLEMMPMARTCVGCQAVREETTES